MSEVFLDLRLAGPLPFPNLPDSRAMMKVRCIANSPWSILSQLPHQQGHWTGNGAPEHSPPSAGNSLAVACLRI